MYFSLLFIFKQINVMFSKQYFCGSAFLTWAVRFYPNQEDAILFNSNMEPTQNKD